MFLGPIFSYEMLTSGRRSRYYLVRLAYAAFLFFVLISSYKTAMMYRHFGGIYQQANIAGEYFRNFTLTQLAAVLLVGPVLAAGTIAVERDRRTIEYLLATDLSNGEIVLGKLFARLLLITSIIIVGLPILSIAMLMGGIAPDRLAMVFLLTLSTMVAVSSLSIVISVWAPKAREAITRAYLILFMLVVAPLVLKMLLAVVGTSVTWWLDWLVAQLSVVVDWLCLSNPLVTTFSIFSSWSFHPMTPWEAVWKAVACHTVFTVVALTAAVWGVRRVHLKSTEKLSRAKKTRSFQFGWRPSVWDHSMLWKECYSVRHVSRLGVVVGGIAVFAILIFLGLVLWQAIEAAGDEEIVVLMAVITGVLGCGGLLLAGARAAGLVTVEKEKDTWITLLSTPLTGRQILMSKVIGNLYANRWLVFILAGLWLLGCLRTPRLLAAALPVLLVLLILLMFVTVMGVNYSLRLSNSARALGGATLGTGFFVGGGYLMCCFPLAFWMGSRSDDVVLIAAGLMPFLLVFPIEAFADERYGQRMSFNNEDFFEAIACVMGTIGYAVAAAIILFIAIDGFQRATGRREGSQRL